MSSFTTSVVDMDTNDLADWISTLGKSAVWQKAAVTVREVRTKEVQSSQRMTYVMFRVLWTDPN